MTPETTILILILVAVAAVMLITAGVFLLGVMIGAGLTYRRQMGQRPGFTFDAFEFTPTPDIDPFDDSLDGEKKDPRTRSAL